MSRKTGLFCSPFSSSFNIIRSVHGMEENPIREAMSEESYLEFSEMLAKMPNSVYTSGDMLPVAFSEIDLALLFVRSAVCLLGKQKIYNICSDYSINYGRFGRKAWETRLRQLTVKLMFYLAKDVAVPKVTATWAI